MTDVAPDATINVGELLVAGARIAARHWLLALVACIVLATGLFAIVDVVGHSVVDGTGPARQIFRGFGRQAPAYLGDLTILASNIAGFLVLTVMLGVFYRGERPDFASAVGGGAAQFVARVALAYIIVLAPQFALDSGYRHLAPLLFPDHLSVPELWLLYFAIRATALLIASLLHAGLVLYLPSGVYEQRPEGLTACWLRTLTVRRKLFFTYFLIAAIATAFQFLFGNSAHLVDFAPIAGKIAAWRALDPRYVSYFLPSLISYSLFFPVIVLLESGISLVAYRKLAMIDQMRARVFD